jgi:ABC-2 type transport system permease protein
MNLALLRKSLLDARWLLISAAALLFGFNWLFVWLVSLFELGALKTMLMLLPLEFQALPGIPIEAVATESGRIAMAYIDPLVIFTATIWGIARGSDAVSGEIGRGTMELLLAQPVRRLTVLTTQATVTVGGAAVLAASCWLGTCTGLALMDIQGTSPSVFVPGALNLFALTFFLAGMSTMFSSWESYRTRTIGLAGAVLMISLIIKIVARTAPNLGWLMYFTFLGAYEPQVMIVRPHEAWALSLRYDGVLLAFGLAGYIAAAVIFCRRDLPAPL